MTKISTQELLTQIRELESYFKAHDNSTDLSKLNQVKANLQNETYNIAIVANMSAGKSTFINALFGEEILPSSTGATTDCATYIHSKRDGSTQKQALITFEKGKKITLNENRIKELKQYAKKDSDVEKQFQKVKEIHLHYPFKHIPKEEQKNNLKIFFVDTPGPHNQGQSGEKHSEQTRSTISKAEVVLFLFDFEQIPSTYGRDGNPNDLWSIIKERKDSNPSLKVFFIVNKIDTYLKDAIKESDPWDAVKKRKGQIEKELKEVAKEKGMKNAEVFFTAAELALTKRRDLSKLENKPLASSLERQFDNFERDFKDIYPESDKKQALYDFMGIDIMEDKINDYLSNEASAHFLESNQEEIFGFIQTQRNNLQIDIQTLQKPKLEAQEDLKHAKAVLENIQAEQDNLTDKLHSLQEETLANIMQTLQNRFDEIFDPKLMAANAIHSYNHRNLSYADFKWHVNDILEKCQAKFTSHNDTINAHYQNHQASTQMAINQFKSNLKDKINKALNVQLEFKNTEQQAHNTKLKNISVDADGIVSYTTTRGFWSSLLYYGTLTLFDAGETHQHIDEAKLQNNLKKALGKERKEFINQAYKAHEETLQNGSDINDKEIQNFIQEQYKAIKRLNDQLQTQESSLAKAKQKEKAFYALEVTKKFMQACATN